MGVLTNILSDVYSHISNNWTRTPVVYDNTEQTYQNTSWIRVTIAPATAEPACIGSNKIRVTGQIIIQIFTPIGDGPKPAFEIADEIAELMQNKSIGSVTNTWTAETLRIGDDNNGWYQINVLIPFHAQ